MPKAIPYQLSQLPEQRYLLQCTAMQLQPKDSEIEVKVKLLRTTHVSKQMKETAAFPKASSLLTHPKALRKPENDCTLH